TAVLRLKGYIENPSSSPMRSIIVRFLAGGALFGMPIVLAAMASAISGQDYAGDFAFSALLSSVSGIFAQLGVGGSTGSGFNEVLDNIVSSIHFVPGLISAVAYLLGLVMAFS